MNATAEIPAERLRPGRAMQHVNVFVDGVFVRQMRYPGTAEEAQAYAAVYPLHDKHPEYLTRLAAYHAAKDAAKNTA